MTPTRVNSASQGFRRRAWSVIAPSSGARRTTTRLARPFARPSRNVVTVLGAPSFHAPASMTGTKAVSTASAKAEFAQS